MKKHINIQKTIEAIGLLNSMVACGDEHSQQSNNVVKQAREALYKLEKVMDCMEIIPDDYIPQVGDIIEFRGHTGKVHSTDATSLYITIPAEKVKHCDPCFMMTKKKQHKVIQLANGKHAIYEGKLR